jgi:hypothetical protein
MTGLRPPSPPEPADEMELRVRAALAARAQQVTLEQLRPADPPGLVFVPRRPRSAWLPALAAAAAVLMVLALVLTVRQRGPVAPTDQPTAPAVQSTAPAVQPSTPTAQPTTPAGRPTGTARQPATPSRPTSTVQASPEPILPDGVPNPAQSPPRASAPVRQQNGVQGTPAPGATNLSGGRQP